MVASVLMMAMAAVAFAGADSSGGGKSVVCRDSATQQLKSVEMLDLFEARAMYGLEPLAMGATEEEALAAAKAKILSTTFDSVIYGPEFDQLAHDLHIMPPGTRLEPVDDASPVVIPTGCELEQAAVWVDDSLVVVDNELWNAMDGRNRAALVAHEIIYSHTRGEGATNSRRARKIVGYLFSKFDFVSVRDGLPAHGGIMCVTGSEKSKTFSEFFVYPSASGDYTLQFEVLHDQWLYSKTTGVFNGVRYDPAEQKDYVSALATLNSRFETGRSFQLDSSADATGARVLTAVEYDDKGQPVSVPLNCHEQP